MHLYPSRLKETSEWLDVEWELWNEIPPLKKMDKSRLMEIFLDIIKATGSSIDEAYIDAWHEQKIDASFTRSTCEQQKLKLC